MKSTSLLVFGYQILLGSMVSVYTAQASASLMCMVNRTGDPGAANVCDDTAGSPTPNQTAAARVGNPIHVLSGNKYQQDTDASTVADRAFSEITRHYNSSSVDTGILGVGWRLSSEVKLKDDGDNIQIIQSNGKRIILKSQDVRVHSNSQVMVSRCASENPAEGWVERRVRQGHKTWVWHLPSGQQYHFSVISKQWVDDSTIALLSQVVDAAGATTTTFRYRPADQKLVSVEDQQGSLITFHYAQTSHQLPLIILTTPRGSYRYYQDRMGNLSQVVYPDGRRIAYQYSSSRSGDAHNLTAKWLYTSTQQQPQLLGQWHYDAFDRAISSVHAEGNDQVSISYDTRAPIAPTGKTTPSPIFENTITNSLGQKTIYRYQIAGMDYQLLSVMGVGCRTCGETNIRYQYTPQGQIKTKQYLNDNGEVLRTDQYQYNAQQQLRYENIQLAGQPAQEFFYDYQMIHPKNPASWRLSQVRRPSVYANHWALMSYQYNSQGLLTRQTQTGYHPNGQPLSRQIDYGYDRKGRLIWENGALPDVPNAPLKSDIQVYRYDEHGRLKQLMQPAQQAHISIERNHLGQVVAYRRQHGQQIERLSYQYHPQGLLKALSYQADGAHESQTLHYHYDAQQRLSSVTDPQGQLIQSFAYDQNHRVNGLAAQGLGVLHWQRNTEDQLTQQIFLGNQGYHVRGIAYDAQAQAATVAHNGRSATISHNAQITTTTHPNQQIWQTSSTTPTAIAQRMIAATTSDDPTPPAIQTWSYRLGSKHLRLADGTQVSYYVDDFGRPARMESNLSGRIEYLYDAADRLIQIRKPQGVQINYQYDAWHRRIAKQVISPKKTETTHWLYQGQQLVQIKHPQQITTLDYDDQQRLSQRRIQLTGLPQPLVTRYQYDTEGQLSQVQLPDGLQITQDQQQLRYQFRDQLFAQAFLNQHDQPERHQRTYQLGDHIHMAYEYDQMGQWRGLHYAQATSPQWSGLINRAYANPDDQMLLSQRWQFDDQHRLTQVDEQIGSTRQQQQLRYNYADQLLQNTYQPIGHTTSVHQHSSSPQPLALTQERFAYDGNGNRLLSQTISDSHPPAPTQRYRYHAGQLQQIEQIATQPQAILQATYNAAGQPIRYGDFEWVFDADRLTDVYRHHQGKKQLIAHYDYNADGQRVHKVVFADPQGQPYTTPQHTYAIYDGHQLQYELNAAGHIIRHYVYLGEQPIATVDYDGQGAATTTAAINTTDRWLAWAQRLTSDAVSGHWHYVLADYLGRPRAVVNDQQQTVWRLQASAFGGQAQPLQTSTHGRRYDMPLRFVGQYADAETGLYYNGYRYYDPQHGRYVSPDPLGLRGGNNFFGYVNQAPTQYIDPEGLLLFAFDGTGNQDYHSKPEKQAESIIRHGDDVRNSNVVRFRDAYQGDPDEPWIEDFQGLNGFKNNKFIGQDKAFDTHQFKNAFYISGAGTEDQYTGIGTAGSNLGNLGTGILYQGIDAGFGLTVYKRVDAMLGYAKHYLNLLSQKQVKDAKASTNGLIKRKNLNIDITGFSRGAASARIFASAFERALSGQSGDYSWSNYTAQNLARYGICINFRYMGIFDTVSAFGASNYDDAHETDLDRQPLKVSNAFNYVAHAIAVNEHRENFHVRSIYDSADDAKKANQDIDANIQKLQKGDSSVKIRVERGFLGAHSDIGGGYTEGDLPHVSLMWMIDQAEKAGVKFDRQLINQRQYNQVNNPVVHDSVGIDAGIPELFWATMGLIPTGTYFTPGRQVLWGETEKKSQGVAQRDKDQLAHLKLVWEQTLQFENERGGKKFEQAQKLEKEYDDADAIQCRGISIPVRCDPLEAYYKLKTAGLLSNGKSGGKDNQVIMYNDASKNKDEAIQIQNYLNWINNNYQMDNNSLSTGTKP